MENPRITEFIANNGEHISMRPLVKEDLPSLEWEGEYSHFRKLYSQHFANAQTGNTLIWVATDNKGKVIGQVFILLFARDREIADGVRRAYLFSFRVRQEWRNKGIGSQMMEFVEAYLKRRGFSWLRLNVGRENQQAIDLYKRRGYRIMGPEAGIWKYQDQYDIWQTVTEPAWRMIKELPELA